MKAKTVFACKECGYESAKWLGKCPSCGSWNTLVEFTPVPEPKQRGIRTSSLNAVKPQKLADIDINDEERFTTGMNELDRVLGGGAVVGSFVLVGGEPGVGKSTMLMQICSTISLERTILYVSGEESARQLKLRAKRLDVNETGDSLLFYAQTRLEDILTAVENYSPQFLIIDSIQTIYTDSVDSAPGGVTQIRECAQALMRCAKENGITIFLIGHVTKEGTLAGPKILEHMVDCVVYFEGERHASYRIIRTAKNRFGSTDEIGVFEMTDKGLLEIPNPSAALLSGRPRGSAGSCVACVMEGTRPILAEIQALVTASSYGTSRRMSAGFDYNRAMLLIAVLEKRAGMQLSGCDAYINVIGGLKVDEPASDLPAIISIASSMKDRAVQYDTVCFGEIGLTGELRTVNSAQQRVNEVKRLGFSRCVLPARCVQGLSIPEGLELIPVRTVSEAIDAAII